MRIEIGAEAVWWVLSAITFAIAAYAWVLSSRDRKRAVLERELAQTIGSATELYARLLSIRVCPDCSHHIRELADDIHASGATTAGLPARAPVVSRDPTPNSQGDSEAGGRPE